MRAVFVALLLCAAPAVFAQNVPPSEESVRHLLDLEQTHRAMDEALNNMDGYLQKAMEQSRQGQTLNAKQQQILDQFRSDMLSTMKDELAWSKLEPGVVAIYTKTFSQKEISDLIAFYSSPSGQSVANKLPIVSREMAARMQERMLNVMQHMQQASREMQTKLRAAGEEAGTPPAH